MKFLYQLALTTKHFNRFQSMINKNQKQIKKLRKQTCNFFLKLYFNLL